MSDFKSENRPDRDTARAVKHTARDKAGEGAGLVKEKTADAAVTAKERAGDVAGEATTQARDVASELRNQLQDQAWFQTRRLAQNVRQLADELGDMGESGKDDSSAANVVRQLASSGQDVADRLEDRGPQGLVSDLQGFARRHPGTFLAGAALAGFAAVRLGKGVKSANDGASSSPNGDRGEHSKSVGGNGERRAVLGGDQSAGATGHAESYEPQATPSYGGSVVAPGPVPGADPSSASAQRQR